MSIIGSKAALEVARSWYRQEGSSSNHYKLTVNVVIHRTTELAYRRNQETAEDNCMFPAVNAKLETTSWAECRVVSAPPPLQADSDETS